MKWLGSYLVILAGVLIQVQPSRISLDDDAQALCEKYKMICKTGKICAVQHFDYPNNVTFPVCIPLSFVPVRNMICELQPLPGPCGARYIRWYYNKHAQECAYFRYGGCEGNQNNFKSKKDCEGACMSVPSISLYQGSQSSLSAVKPAVMTAPIYEPPDVKYEALNSIMIPGNENNYDRYSASRYRKMQDDDSNTRTRRRSDKEKAKEKRRRERERRKERKRLKRLRRRQKKLLREGKKHKKDRKKKKKKTEEEGVVTETAAENAVTEEKQTNTVEEISNIVDNAISDKDNGQKGKRGERKGKKRRRKRQKRPKKKDRKSKKSKRDNKKVERQYRRHAPSYQSDDSGSYRMLSLIDQIAKSRTQSGSIVYSDQ